MTSLTVRNAKGTLFTVSAASTRHFLVGWRPRMVQAGTDFSLSLWHGGSGGTGIPFAGVGETSLAPARVSKVVRDGSNGNGGDVVDQVFSFTKTEVHRLMVPSSVNHVRLNFGVDSARLNVHTVAKTIRAERPLGAVRRYSYPMSSSTYASFDLYAVDDLGFVDVRVGGYTGGSTTTSCFSYAPMKCTVAPVTVSCSLSANGRTTGGFSPSVDTFLAAKNIAGTMDDANKKMSDGVGKNIRVQFAQPFRYGYPIFSTGALTSGVPADREVSKDNSLDMSVGVTGLNIATIESATTRSQCTLPSPWRLVS